MIKKLYVGGLSYSTTNQSLEKYFQQAGQVQDAVVITDKYTGRSKGFGFVEMSTPAEANAAITKFNGTEMDGRTITVNEAKEREPREQNRRW